MRRITFVNQLRKLVCLTLAVCLYPLSSLAVLRRPQRAVWPHAAATPLPRLAPDESALKLAGARQPSNARVADLYGKLPLSFEQNLGQTDPRVKFFARGSGFSLFLTATDAVFSLRKAAALPKQGRRGAELGASSAPENYQSAPLRMTLEGANTEVQLSGLEETPGKSNYLVGDDPARWRTNVPNYARVRYEAVYPGVDLIFYGTGQQLEYDFRLAPCADPSRIILDFDGARSVGVDSRGDLVVQTAAGVVRWRKPVAYQEAGDARRIVKGKYVLKGKNRVGFQVAAYDASRPLVIDPVLVYSSYLNTSPTDTCRSVAVDSSGKMYVAGHTVSAAFPVKSAVQPVFGGLDTGVGDAFVTKIDPSKSGADSLVYSTFLGGRYGDASHAIAVDGSGYAYVTGVTQSDNFPVTPGAFQRFTHGVTSEGFVSKLSRNGSSLVYSTYLGGSRDDSFSIGVSLNGIAVDSAGHAWVTGVTNSLDFPTTPNAFRATKFDPTPDAYLTRLNQNGSALDYSTYLGGSFYDYGTGVAVDASGNAYVTGTTRPDVSPAFPTTPNAFQTSGGGYEDVFVAKINPTKFGADTLVYSTYLGGELNDESFGIAVDDGGNAYVTGMTQSSNFPTRNALQPNLKGGFDVFVTKLNANGSALVYSTFLGGTANDVGFGITTDASGNAYVTGNTQSNNFPVKSVLHPLDRSVVFTGLNDAFITKLDAAGSALIFSNSSSPGAEGRDIAVDDGGNLYLAGKVSGGSNLFTTAGAFQKNSAGGGFIQQVFDESSAGIVPNRGGNTGSVTVQIFPHGGFRLQQGLAVKLVKPGQSDIVGALSLVTSDGMILMTTFDLKVKSLGVYDVVVNNPDSTGFTLPRAFTIEAGNAPRPWSDIIGPRLIRPGETQTYYIVYGNKGNVDAVGVPLWIDGIPKEATWSIGFKIAPPPQVAGIPSYNWNDVPIHTTTARGIGLPLFIPIIPPGQTKTLRITIKATANQLGQTFTLHTWVNEPYFHSPFDSAVRDCLLSTLSEALNIVGAVTPGSSCLFAGAQALGNLYTSAVQLRLNEENGDPSTETKVFSQVQMGAAVIGLFTTCTQSFLGLGVVANASQIAFGARDLVGNCGPIFFPILERHLPVTVINALDPNEKVGAGGVGTGRYISGDQSMAYAIYFENQASATAPAQQVVITDQLDTEHLDLNTFSFAPMTFGDHVAGAPPEASKFATDVDLRPAKNLVVRINGQVNRSTGLLTWRFSSIDPDTGLPTGDPLAGFLPPNNTSPEGQGSVFFTVSLKPGLPTGSETRNAASIVFDTNTPIETPAWLNTIDNAKPDSHVLLLAETQNSTSFEVAWTGTDEGAGIQDYTVFVSEDGGPYNVWQNETPATSAVFAAQSGKTYAFYSVARDAVGNVEDAPSSADAATTVAVTSSADLSLGQTASPDPFTVGSEITYTITLNNRGPNDAADLIVKDELPAGTTFVSCAATGGGVCGGAGNSRLVSFSSLPADSSAVITLVVATDCSRADGAQVSNTATVSSIVSDLNPENNSATAFAAASDPPPTIKAPPALSMTTGPGATACGVYIADADLGVASADDNCPGVVITREGAPAGNFFPVGATTITWTATDARGQTATGWQRVMVADTTPPTVFSPPDMAAGNDLGTCSARLNIGQATTSDNCSGVTVAGVRGDGRPLNAPYPVGGTVITWTARDAAGNTATSLQSVVINDAEAPTIRGLAASVLELWPADHRMVSVTVGYDAVDNCGPASSSLGVTSSEPVNGTGDGDTSPDWQIVDAHHVFLRAERAGVGGGRVYTVTITATDGHGNFSRRSVEVSVPKSQGLRK